MSREETWNGYIESMALLARAELRTAAARLALEEAEAQEATLRHAVRRARDELDAVAAREAGGLWISLDEWSAKRESPPDAASVLETVKESLRDNGHVEVLQAD